MPPPLPFSSVAWSRTFLHDRFSGDPIGFLFLEWTDALSYPPPLSDPEEASRPPFLPRLMKDPKVEANPLDGLLSPPPLSEWREVLQTPLGNPRQDGFSVAGSLVPFLFLSSFHFRLVRLLAPVTPRYRKWSAFHRNQPDVRCYSPYWQERPPPPFFDFIFPPSSHSRESSFSVPSRCGVRVFPSPLFFFSYLTCGSRRRQEARGHPLKLE